LLWLNEYIFLKH